MNYGMGFDLKYVLILRLWEQKYVTLFFHFCKRSTLGEWENECLMETHNLLSEDIGLFAFH